MTPILSHITDVVSEAWTAACEELERAQVGFREAQEYLEAKQRQHKYVGMAYETFNRPQEVMPSVDDYAEKARMIKAESISARNARSF
jgi:hypothetical protein